MLFCFPGERQKRCVLLLEVLLFCARMQADASRRPSPPLFLEVAAPTASSRRTREKRAIVVVFFFFFFWRKKKQKHVLIFFSFLGFHINPKRSKLEKPEPSSYPLHRQKEGLRPRRPPPPLKRRQPLHIYIYREREREKRENRDVCNHHHRCCSCCYY